MEDFINSRFPKMNLPINQDCKSCQYLVKENYELKKLLYETKNELDDLKSKKEGKSIPLFTIRSSCDESKCVDTKSLNYGERTQIWSFIPDNKNQIFELERSDKQGFYLLKNNASGLYLGMEDNKGWIITMKKKGENNQNFKFIDVKNGFYMIENETGYVIDLGNWVTDNGNVVSACEKNSSTAQQWKLVLL